MLAAVHYSDPLLWAVFVGWIMSVVLHEFAHGIVAHFGGDYTIKERGGLTLNPLQYVDPFMSILLPAVIFLMGGVPLPGGVTYIRRDLLRNRAWQVAVSAAGPAMNFIIFLALVIPFHPKIGWIDASSLATTGVRTAILFVGAMAWLQMISVLLNVIPVPPLDGFQMISEFMDEETRLKFLTPPTSTMLFVAFFMILWNIPRAFQYFHNGVENTLRLLGFDERTIDFFGTCYNKAIFGVG